MQKHSLKGAGNGSPPTREFWKLIESGPQHAAGAELPSFVITCVDYVLLLMMGEGRREEGRRWVFMGGFFGG